MKILLALVKKEFCQIIRDPSSIMIAFVLPIILIWIFAYGISLDTNRVKIGLLVEDSGPQVNSLAASFENNNFTIIKRYVNRKSMENGLVAGHIRGMIIIPTDFTKKMDNPFETPSIQIITDGSETNTANFVQNYGQAIVQKWQAQTMNEKNAKTYPTVTLEPRFWFNQELKSIYFLLPGSIAIIMTLIGLLLTSLVIAREWERGTMESLLTTKATKADIILSKYIAYYCLAMSSLIFCVILLVTVFQVPFRGSFLLLFIVSSLFLSTALGIGLLISTLTKSQFLSCMASSIIGFLPAIMLSGLIYEPSSMPKFIEMLSNIIPAKYYVTSVQNLFMAGNIMGKIVPECFILFCISIILFIIIYKKTPTRLE